LRVAGFPPAGLEIGVDVDALESCEASESEEVPVFFFGLLASFDRSPVECPSSSPPPLAPDLSQEEPSRSSS